MYIRGKIKKHYLILVVLLVLSVLLVSFPQIVMVKAQSNTIYIRVDGSVEGTDMIVHDGDLYTLIEDISGKINVEPNFTIIDG